MFYKSYIFVFYDADIDISDWKIQPDFAAEKVEDIIKTTKTVEPKINMS